MNKRAFEKTLKPCTEVAVAAHVSMQRMWHLKFMKVIVIVCKNISICTLFEHVTNIFKLAKTFSGHIVHIQL